MAQVPISAATTSAVTGAIANARGYMSVVISADNLATTEEADIYVMGKAVTLTDGTVVKLTASIPAVELAGGVQYTVDKDVTAGACTLWMSGNAGINE